MKNQTEQANWPDKVRKVLSRVSQQTLEGLDKSGQHALAGAGGFVYGLFLGTIGGPLGAVALVFADPVKRGDPVRQSLRAEEKDYSSPGIVRTRDRVYVVARTAGQVALGYLFIRARTGLFID